MHTLEATARDDVLDLFDAVLTRFSAVAGKACAALFDENLPDAAVRAAASEAVTPDALQAVRFYMDAALNQLHAEGFGVRDEDMTRLSPLGLRQDA